MNICHSFFLFQVFSWLSPGKQISFLVVPPLLSSLELPPLPPHCHSQTGGNHSCFPLHKSDQWQNYIIRLSVALSSKACDPEVVCLTPQCEKTEPCLMLRDVAAHLQAETPMASTIFLHLSLPSHHHHLENTSHIILLSNWQYLYDFEFHEVNTHARE